MNVTEVVELASWNAFLDKLHEFRNTPDLTEMLFRGHADSTWQLETTLERRGHLRMSVEDYYHLIAVLIRPQLESVIGRTFDLPEYSELVKNIKDYDAFSTAMTFGRVPGYSFMVNMRHHGFPSPLLDWTRSAHIAAFFAFAPLQIGVKARSIYAWAYRWARAASRVISAGEPEFRRMGPYVTTHRRHVLQQCDYTMCATFRLKEEEWRFAAQEPTLSRGSMRLFRFDIPSTERLTVLRELDLLNLNAYSLFGSEEGLMEALAIRELDLRTNRFSPG